MGLHEELPPPKDVNSGDNNGWADFRGKKRSNDTHESAQFAAYLTGAAYDLLRAFRLRA
tara:strand:- start:155 stop:331 length:177 start_codon:yes stop_codon:yes gene_type:complete